ncbi:hypothetical protein [Stakelama saccharophila]|uniref:Transposase n=1 Tax=Stakelama saccharophila TaxID=3075605 RepID=A0ABZ0B8H6_9SPHN|nr:hypothetical protein [Stakelama sp. W311]WNO53168.1 hypothetical protein RPR59_12035 [Stakelama sp. W311]
MLHYPDKLRVLFPGYEVRDHRYHLVSIDNVLTVHRRPGGEFMFQLDPLQKLGPRSYARCLIDLAADLQAGYTLIVVERDRFLFHLETAAREHAAKKDSDEVERCAHVILEHTHHRIRDHLDGSDDGMFRADRMMVGYRKRGSRDTQGGTGKWNVHNGIVTPRAEQLWHAIVRDLCDVRTSHRAFAAWDRWTKANRPPMPR